MRKDFSFCSFASSLHSGAACLNLLSFVFFLIKKIGKRRLGPGSALGEKGENKTGWNRKYVGTVVSGGGKGTWRFRSVSQVLRLVPPFYQARKEWRGGYQAQRWRVVFLIFPFLAVHLFYCKMENHSIRYLSLWISLMKLVQAFGFLGMVAVHVLPGKVYAKTIQA